MVGPARERGDAKPGLDSRVCLKLGGCGFHNDLVGWKCLRNAALHARSIWCEAVLGACKDSWGQALMVAL